MDILDRLGIEVPVVQAGMGTIATAELAAAVCGAGGLGTIGTHGPELLDESIGDLRAACPGATVSVNLLMPFVTRAHVEVCVRRKVDVVTLAFGGNASLVAELRASGATVVSMVGGRRQALEAIDMGVDVLVVQGGEAGGHLVGENSARHALADVLEIAGGRPVLLAGGIADGNDTREALDAGASGVVAGTRFLLTEESDAHPEYKRRVVVADSTLRTTLFGFGWPAPHRVVPNAATSRWCGSGGRAHLVPRVLNAPSGVLARVAPESEDPTAFLRRQRPEIPLFTPVAPTSGAPQESVDASALYAGKSALRMDTVVSARTAVAMLSP